MAELPTNATETFDVAIPAGLKQFGDKARELNAIYGFKVSGEGGGDWTVDLASDPPSCVRGDTGKAQCTIEIDHEDFKSMLKDPNQGMQLYFQGKLRVSGDPMLAMKLQQLFELAKT